MEEAKRVPHNTPARAYIKIVNNRMGKMKYYIKYITICIFNLETVLSDKFELILLPVPYFKPSIRLITIPNHFIQKFTISSHYHHGEHVNVYI